MGIIINIPTQQNSIGDSFEAMNFELAGVISVTYVLKKFGASEMERFSKEGHPSVIIRTNFFKNKVAPSYTRKLHHFGGHPPFGIFFATKEINPDCERPLISRSDIEHYREQFGAIFFNPQWTDWDDVIRQFSISPREWA